MLAGFFEIIVRAISIDIDALDDFTNSERLVEIIV